MSRILVPTDFSDCAKRASSFAVEVASKNGAELHFVHLMDVPIDWLKLIEKDQKQLYPDVTKKVNEANNQLDLLMVSAEKKGLEAKKFIAYNAGYSYLKDHIAKSNCDMVVMGSHGASGFTEWFIGSNTQKVVRFSPVPVIVTKGGVTFNDVSSVVFASDFDKDMFDGYDRLLNVVRMLDLKLDLVFVNTPGTFTESEVIQEKMNRFVQMGEDVMAGFGVYNSYEFEDGLVKYAKDHGQMIAMVTHGAKGSLTERIINHVDMPVLSIRV